MKVLITGAHFTPAVAVIEQLHKLGIEDIVYLGRNNTMDDDKARSVESQILPKLGVKFIPIMVGRFSVRSFFKIPVGFLQSLFYLLKEQPNVVLSFGGYVAVPSVIWAWALSIPVLIHEQTLVSGLANRISAVFADKIALSFSNGKTNQKTIVTGNPLRPQILQPDLYPADEVIERFFKQAKKNQKPVLFITGGNQGSHAINLAVEEALPKLLGHFDIIHQSGDSKYGDFNRLLKVSAANYLVFKFIDKGMGRVIKNSDLIVCRAGANTLVELAYLSKPALCIPLPGLYKDEQNVNALFFAKHGLLEILPQSKLEGATLTERLLHMRQDLVQLKIRAHRTKAVVLPDAASYIALQAKLLVR